MDYVQSAGNNLINKKSCKKVKNNLALGKIKVMTEVILLSCIFLMGVVVGLLWAESQAQKIAKRIIDQEFNKRGIYD